MVITAAHLSPIIALIAGILILVMPRLLNYVVAFYLIAVGPDMRSHAQESRKKVWLLLAPSFVQPRMALCSMLHSTITARRCQQKSVLC